MLGPVHTVDTHWGTLSAELDTHWGTVSAELDLSWSPCFSLSVSSWVPGGRPWGSGPAKPPLSLRPLCASPGGRNSSF